MNKTAKFLLCENPIADKSDGRQFILHNREPIFLAEIHAYEDLTENQIMDLQKQISIGSRLDYDNERFFFIPIWISQTNIGADNITGIFKRMADWYEAYLIWEDKQDEKKKEILTNIGMLIKIKRKERKLTQAVLAEKSNISVLFLGQIEKGKVNPSINTLINISNALKCKLGLIMTN